MGECRRISIQTYGPLVVEQKIGADVAKSEEEEIPKGNYDIQQPKSATHFLQPTTAVRSRQSAYIR